MHWADFIAGSVGGALGVAVGYPLDTVKVRIQTQRKSTGVWDCIRTTCRTEGIYGFYKGISMPVTTVSVSSSLVFGTYRSCLQGLHGLRGGNPQAPHCKVDIFLSGMAGGVAQVSVMSPADIVKVRLQCQMGSSNFETRYRGPLHCILSIAREEGILGLYKGSGALAIRDGCSFSTYFLTYNLICTSLTPPEQKEPDWVVVMLAGGVSGMCGWAVGTPMDVIKARLQVDGMGRKRYRGFLHCASKSVRQEGFGVFFKGLGLNCLRAFPVNMAVFSAYELVLRLLHQ